MPHPRQWALDAVTSPLVYVTVGIAVGVRVVGTSESVSTVVALSALPIVGLSVLARTPFGRALQDGVTARAAELRAAAETRERERAAARAARHGPKLHARFTPLPQPGSRFCPLPPALPQPVVRRWAAQVAGPAALRRLPRAPGRACCGRLRL
jgi:hypothetical protein